MVRKRTNENIANRPIIPQIQPKLEIGSPNDKYEKQADAVANRVVAMPNNTGTIQMQSHLSSPDISMMCAECEKEKGIQMQPNEEEGIRMKPEEEEEKIQMKPSIQRSANGTMHASAEFANKLQSQNSQGRPLPGSVNYEMGNKIGSDFSNVKIHTNSQAVQMSQEIGAQAFTHGSDIYFNKGQYSPDTSEGKKLLAHELVHVVQQKRSFQSSLQRKGSRTDSFGKECPDTVVIGSIKPLAGFSKALFDKGFRTSLGIYSYMKVGGPKKKYESCISEVLKVEENTCGNKGKFADYKPCSPKKYCLLVGGTKDIPTDDNIFLDMHRSRRKFNLLEGSGKKMCKVTCLQRYGCGGKEIGRFYVTRTFEAAIFRDGKKRVPVTLGSIKKVIAKRKK